MEEKEMTIHEKAILQAAASIRIDDLPLSLDYVKNYINEEIEKENPKKLILKRSDENE